MYIYILYIFIYIIYIYISFFVVQSVVVVVVVVVATCTQNTGNTMGGPGMTYRRINSTGIRDCRIATPRHTDVITSTCIGCISSSCCIDILRTDATTQNESFRLYFVNVIYNNRIILGNI